MKYKKYKHELKFLKIEKTLVFLQKYFFYKVIFIFDKESEKYNLEKFFSRKCVFAYKNRVRADKLCVSKLPEVFRKLCYYRY